MTAKEARDIVLRNIDDFGMTAIYENIRSQAHEGLTQASLKNPTSEQVRILRMQGYKVKSQEMPHDGGPLRVFEYYVDWGTRLQEER